MKPKMFFLRFALFAFSSLTVLLTQSSSAVVSDSKNHRYDLNFVNKVNGLFFDNGNLSQEKIQIYIERLAQKKREVVGLNFDNSEMASNSILISKYRLDGKSDKKIMEELLEHEVTYAYDKAIELISLLPQAQSQAELFDNAQAALNLEESIRIEGLNAPLVDLYEQVIANLISWKIPKKSSATDEASNLYDSTTGEFLSYETIENLKSNRTDLSFYNPPVDSPYWQNPGDISQVDVKSAARGELHRLYKGIDIEFPKENIFYYEEMKHSATKPKMDVYIENAKGKKRKFKLKFGGELHADPVVSAFMLTLGYPADLTRYAKNIKVILGKTTYSEMARDWEVYYSRSDLQGRFKLEDIVDYHDVNDKGENFVVFKEGLIEAKPPKIERLGPWAYGDNSHSSFREVRGLALLQVLFANHDMKDVNNRLLLKELDGTGEYEAHYILSDPGASLSLLWYEMPEIFPWKVVSGKSRNGITLSFLSRPIGVKNKITWADARWTVRWLAGLSREQIRAAVSLGGWPQCLEDIYVEKIISRRNDLVKHLDLVGETLASGEVLQLIPLSDDPKNLAYNSYCDAESIKENYTTEFDFDLGFLLEPIKNATWRTILDTARTLLSGSEKLVISSDNIGTDLGPIAEITFSPDREIERNPNPQSEKELFIVKDTLEMAFRTGVKFGAYIDQEYSIKFTLAYPARSQEEARLSKGFVVDALLALDVAKGRLPEKYVLMTEHSVQLFGAGFDTVSVTRPLQLQAGLKENVRLHRSILDHRDPDNVILYRDRSVFDERFLEASLRALIFKFPIFETVTNWGNSSGKGFIFSAREEGEKTIRQITQSMINGNFSEFLLRERGFELTNRFAGKIKDWNLLFWSGSSSKRLDNIVLAQGDDKKSIVQYRSQKSNSWNFLGNGEKRNVNIEVYSDPNETNPEYQMNLNVLSIDLNTRDKELANSYLGFINGLYPTPEPIIPFTVALNYSANSRWGHLITMSDTHYYPAAIANIMNMTESEFWNSLAQIMNISYQDLQELHKRHLMFEESSTNSGTRSRRYKNAGITHEQNDIIKNGIRFIKTINDIRTAPDFSLTTSVKDKSKIKLLADAIRQIVYTRHKSGFYEHRLLAAINLIAGPNNFYTKNMITSPPFKEMNLVEEEPLYGEYGAEQETSNKYLVYSPLTPLDFYFMFDSWF